MICSNVFKAGTATNPVDLSRYRMLHSDGRRLIESWFRRSKARRQHDNGSAFEAFIFAWFAFNGWGMCVTGANNDSVMIKSLGLAPDLNAKFQQLLAIPESALSQDAKRLNGMLPIFDAKALDDAGLIRFGGGDRTAGIEYYFENGATRFEPRCWVEHRDAGSHPLDWAHSIAAIYKIRCNLFHGRKAAHSEMDSRLVDTAYNTLVNFLEEGGYLNGKKRGEQGEG